MIWAAEVRVTFIRANQTWSAAVINTGARRRGAAQFVWILPSPTPGGIILYWNKPITGPGPIFWCAGRIHATPQMAAHCTHSGGEERSTDISSNGCPLVYMDMGIMETTSTSIKENRAQHVFANFILLCCYVDKCLQPMTLMNENGPCIWFVWSWAPSAAKHVGYCGDECWRYWPGWYQCVALARIRQARARAWQRVATDDGNGHKTHSVSSSHHQHPIFSTHQHGLATENVKYLPFKPFTDTCEHPPRQRIHSSWGLTLLPAKLILYVNWNCKYDLIFLASDIFDLFEYWIWRNGHDTNSVHPSKPSKVQPMNNI